MTASFRDIPTIFGLALEIDSLSEREEYLSHACGGDLELRRRIDELLRDHFEAGEFLNNGPLVETRIALPDEAIGSMIGPYRLQERLGEGGMGIVYIASQSHPVRRTVALKIIKPGMDSREVLGRFQAERQILALLDHPCITRVYDAGITESGHPYFVMELIRGIPLTEYCDLHKLSLRERLELMVQICQGVQHAHQKGIIHRDLKPQNVLVTEQDGVPTPKLIDFGVAKALNQKLSEVTIHTKHTELLGTPLYMSPEQFYRNLLDIDTRSDVYALGMLLYELLVGLLPFGDLRFSSLSYDEQRRVILDVDIIRPSRRIGGLRPEVAEPISTRRGVDQRGHAHQLRGELDWIILKALEKDRIRRYGSAEALTADLRRYLTDEPVEACPPSPWYLLKKVVRKHRLAIGLSSVFLSLLLIVLLVATAVTFRELRIAEQLATENAEFARSERELRREANHQLALSLFEQSYSKCDPQNASAGLLWLARALHRADELGATDLDRPLRRQIAAWGRLIAPVQAVWSHPQPIKGAWFSPDAGIGVSVSGEGRVRIVDSATGSDRLLSISYPGNVHDTELSPDGKLLAICGADGTARLWETTSERPLEKVLVHSAPVNRIAFSPDSRQIITGSEDHKTRVWDTSTGKAIGEPWQHDSAVSSVAFSPDGMKVAVGTAKGQLSIGPGTGEADVITKTGAHQTYITSVQFSPDGRLLVTTSLDKSAKTWHVSTLAPHGPDLQHEEWVDEASFSPDGEFLATIVLDHSVRVWQTETGKPYGDPLRHDARITSARFSPDGKSLLTGGMDWKVRIWDWRAGKQWGSSINCGAGIGCASFDATGTKIITGDDRGFVRIWDISRRMFSGRQQFSTHNNAEALAVSPDGKRLLTAGEFEGQLWDLENRRPTGPVMKIAGGVSQALFSPDSQYLLICTKYSSNTASLWRVSTSERLGAEIEHPDDVLSGAFSRDGNFFMTASMDRFVRFWDRETQQPFESPLEHPEAVIALAVSPDGRMLISGCVDGQVRRWDLRTRQLIEPTMHHDGQVWCLTFSPDGRTIISGGFDHQVRFWDAESGKSIQMPLDHGDVAVQEMSITPDGEALLVTTGRIEALFWNLALNKPLGPAFPIFHHPGAICITPDGTRYLWASSENTVSEDEIPVPIQGKVEEVLKYASVVTGMTLDETNTARPIDEATWRKSFRETREFPAVSATPLP